MDLKQITDTTQLKAYAYEQIELIEQAQVNLKMIQQRLQQLQEEASHAPAEAPSKPVKA